MKYGWMSEKDGLTMDRILGLVCERFPQGVINTIEIGVREGRTSRSIRDFFKNKNRINFHTGIDNLRDIQVGSPFSECHFIVADSFDASEQVQDNSQHLCFIDANHSFHFTAADFLLYKEKIIKGGYLAFHDTSPNIKPFTDYQGVGKKESHFNFISCRLVVEKMGLLKDQFHGWKLILDEYDEHFPTGGIVLIQKTI